MSDKSWIEEKNLQEDRHPKIFISYCWSSNKPFVLNLARCLMSHGVDVVIDEWDLKPGQDKSTFMKRCVNDPEIANVLIVCDEQYAQKADKNIGGVGEETGLISSEIYDEVNHGKFIPVVIEKDEKGKAYMPKYLEDIIYIDLMGDAFEQGYIKLLGTLYGVSQKPELGKIPEWLNKVKSNSFPVNILDGATTGGLQDAYEALKPEKEQILDKITNYYLHVSRDFNGLPSYQINGYDKAALVELVNEGKVQILTENECTNPHIRGFDFHVPVETQIGYIHDGDGWFVAYPTAAYLQSLEISEKKPFTEMLENGEYQMKFLYFKPNVLLEYFKNPQYSIRDAGYRGCISLITGDESDEDLSYIRDYGLAYRKGAERKERYVGLLLCDLAKLNKGTQCIFLGHLLCNQDQYIINTDCFKNLILGEWADGIWIFDALLEEIQIINQMCENMGLPALFRDPPSLDPEKRWHSDPDYRNMLLPTSDEYYDFITALEKIVVQNLNVKVFRKAGVGFIPIPAEPKETNPKTLQIFETWLERNVRFKSEGDSWKEEIIEPLKQLRRERQTPRDGNKFDLELYTKQDRMIEDIYSAVRNIRLLFANHPSNHAVKNPPEYLIKAGDKIKTY